MSNVFNDYSKLWFPDTDDILTNKPVCIRKIVFRATTDGGGCVFHSLNKDTANPVLTLTNDTFTVNIGSSTVRINDDSGTALDDSVISVGDWAYIYDTETGNNDGWWYISAVDSADVFIDVAIQTNAQGAHALASDASKNYNIKVYTPELCMSCVTETISGTASKGIFTLDWGPKGRWFNNLGMFGIATGVCHIYIM